MRDLAVLDGRLVAPAELPDGAPRIAGDGLVVAPGFVDLHAHLREPGDEGAETIAVGHGGGGARRLHHGLRHAQHDTRAGRRRRLLRELDARRLPPARRVRWIGAVTAARGGEALADLEALAAAGAVAFSDDGVAVTDAAEPRGPGALRRARPAAHRACGGSRAGRRIGDARRLDGGCGSACRGWPPEAELAMRGARPRTGRADGGTAPSDPPVDRGRAGRGARARGRGACGSRATSHRTISP